MTKNIGNILLEKDILLESGTNEVEVLVFRVGAYRLGINVAKVREILSAQKVTQLPKAHKSIVGCFRLRDFVVPCVSLHRHLNQPAPSPADCKLILTEFNRSQSAFVVDEVERIHRISWEQILPAPALVTAVASPITAVTCLEGGLVIMLDFETITAEISQEASEGGAVENPHDVARGQVRVVVADDSATVRRAVEATLRNSGYTQVTSFEHGAQAWNWLKDRLNETGDVRQVVDLVISDVEMPSMDGFHLTRNIKEHPQLRNVPVVLYSSIVTPDNHKKG
ncbi:MAG: chemotaxis protein CheV, partial [Planctomycetales bacterium]|nr:chemotaxis protein CheV [Planctomycetales bacterium]